MVIIGLDISTKIGWARVDYRKDTTHMGTIKAKPAGSHGMVRAHSLWTQLKKVMRPAASYEPPSLIMIENYAFMAKGNTLTKLVEVGAVIRYNLFLEGHQWLEVTPTMLKKFTTNKGNANKEEMMVGAFKRWGVEGTNDEIDAYALATFGGCLMNVWEPEAKFQAEAINRFKHLHTDRVMEVTERMMGP